jgi:hypothetical protein
MAEEGGGGGKFAALLTRKVGGVPAYVYMGVAVLGLAWYLRKRAASKAATTDTTAQNASAGQTFPNAGPMPWSADVFINNQTPAAPTTPATPDTPADKPADTTPRYQAVVPGWHVDQWIRDLQKGYGTAGGNPNASWNLIASLNPGMENNIYWNSNPGNNNNTELNTFKTAAVYRIA